MNIQDWLGVIVGGYYIVFLLIIIMRLGDIHTWRTNWTLSPKKERFTKRICARRVPLDISLTLEQMYDLISKEREDE